MKLKDLDEEDDEEEKLDEEDDEEKKDLEESDDEDADDKKDLEESDDEDADDKKDLEEEEEGDQKADSIKVPAGEKLSEEDEDKEELDEEENSVTADAKPGDKKADNVKVPAGEEDAEKDDEENKKAMAAIEKGLNVTEDVKALFNASGKNLSEGFKKKARTIVESAVKTKVVGVAKALNEHYNKQYKKAVNKHYTKLEEKINSYLNYVIKEWMKDNRVAVERGLQVEAVESFIDGLKGLFSEHYIDIPEGKANLVEKLVRKVEKVQVALNDEINKNVKLTEELGKLKREDIINKQCKDLTESQKIRIKGLAEKVDYENEAQFTKKVSVLKESYFPKKKSVGTKLDVLVEGGFKQDDSSDAMSVYEKALTRTLKK